MEGLKERQARAALVRQAMPGVAELMVDERRRLGDAYVVECQKRGMAGEPGWFYAWEAGMSIGTPWPEALAIVAQVDPRNEIPGKRVVVLRPKGARDGA